MILVVTWRSQLIMNGGNSHLRNLEDQVEDIEFLIGLIDLQVYVLGRMYDHTGQFTYCIQKRGLGISLALLEEGIDIP